MPFRSFRSRRDARGRSIRCTCSLRLEMLEDRCVPTVGLLDPTFGVNGIVTTNFATYSLGGPRFKATAIAGHLDGIVMAGHNDFFQSDLVVIRCDQNGFLDESFGTGGQVTTDLGSDGERATAVAVQGDGKIVVTGYSTPEFEYFVIRYNVDGSLDSSFGEGGRISLDLSPRDVSVQSDGQIVVAGSLHDPASGGDIAAVRLNGDGSYDTTFDLDGTKRIDIAGESECYSMEIQDDGKILLAGSAFIGTVPIPGGGNQVVGHLEVVRLNSDGSLDSTFGSGGIQTLAYGSNSSRVYDVSVQDDGAILLAGQATGAIVPFTSTSALVVRLHSDGSTDTAFGTNGFMIFSVPGTTITLEGPSTVLGLPDGKITWATGYNDGIRVARLNGDGSLDSTFHSSGYQDIPVTPPGSNSPRFAGLVSQPDGKLVIGGHVSQSSFTGGTAAIARLNPDGGLDSTYGDEGWVTLGDTGSTDLIRAIATGADGKIVAVGMTVGGAIGWQLAVARYNPDGSLDNGFGGGGTVTSSLGSFTLTGAGVQADGSIVLVGYEINPISVYDPEYGSYYQPRTDFAVRRLTPSGAIDYSFGNSGKQFVDFSTVDDLYENNIGTEDFARSVIILDDGAILISGGNSTSNLEARLTPNGQLDLAFGDGGKRWTSVASTPPPLMEFPGLDFSPEAMAVQADGKLLLAGQWFQSDGSSDFAIARYEGELSLVGTEGNDTITVEPGTLPGSIRTIVNGIVNDNVMITSTLFVAGLGGDDTITVSAAPGSGLFLAGQGGSDTYDISFGSLLGPVYVVENHEAGTDELIARGTPGNDDLFKDNTKVTLGTPAEETIFHRYIETIKIHGAHGNDTITDPGSNTYLFGDEGDDTIIINATSGSGVTADGGDGSDSYVIGGGILAGPVTILDTGIGSVDSVTIVGTPSDTLVPTETGYILNGIVIDVSPTVEAVDIEGINSAPTVTEVTGQSYTDDGVTLQVVAADSDPGDSLTYSVTFHSMSGAGAVNDPTGFSIDSSGLFHWTPGGGQLGEYTFQVRVEDGGGLFAEQTFVVTTLGVVDGVLTIVGTDGSDRIVVKPTDCDPDELTVRINERDYGFRLRPRDNPDSPYSDVSLIRVHGLAGDDDIIVKPAITIPAWLYGGHGDDKLKGGDGDDVLIGGDGDDVLVGEDGRDLMIGGTGSDKIVGNAGDDLIIAGYTAYDAIDSALVAIMAEWTSCRSNADRVKNLRGDASSLTFADRANGDVYLAVDGSHGQTLTVFDDGVKDVLTGEGGLDWFLFNADGDNEARKDKVTDLGAAEFADDLDFILND